MDEDKKAEKASEKKAAGDTDSGDKPKTASIVEQANTAAERVEKATEELRKENDRKEEIMAEKQLSGEAEAGGEKPKPKSETDEEYADRFRRGEVSPLEDDGIK